MRHEANRLFPRKIVQFTLAVWGPSKAHKKGSLF